MNATLKLSMSTDNQTLSEGIDQIILREDLLELTPMCYAVALKFIGDSTLARQLTEEVLLWAWLNPEEARGDAGLKMGLLSRLRGRYLAAYRQSARKLRLRKPFHLTDALAALRTAS